MKKLATLFAVAALSIGAPVFACPNMDHDQAPKTADKPKDTSGETAKAKDAPKAAPKPADTAKAPAKDAPATPKKSGDKVSIR